MKTGLEKILTNILKMFVQHGKFPTKVIRYKNGISVKGKNRRVMLGRHGDKYVLLLKRTITRKEAETIKAHGESIVVQNMIKDKVFEVKVMMSEDAMLSIVLAYGMLNDSEATTNNS